MRQPTATATTEAPALRDQPHHDDHHDRPGDLDRAWWADHAVEPKRSRLWALIEALAYAGAIVDPSGILAVERLRRAAEEAERDRRA